jgi:hypothetical protein
MSSKPILLLKANGSVKGMRTKYTQPSPLLVEFKKLWRDGAILVAKNRKQGNVK